MEEMNIDELWVFSLVRRFDGHVGKNESALSFLVITRKKKVAITQVYVSRKVNNFMKARHHEYFLKSNLEATQYPIFVIVWNTISNF